MTIIPLLATSLLTAWAISNEALLAKWDTQTWLLVTLLLTLTSAIALTPPTFLALVFGYFLGLTAIPYLIFLNLGAIGLVYSFAHFLDAGTTLPYLIKAFPKANKLLQRFHDNQLRLIFFAKLSPVLPFAVTNLFFAIAGAKFKQVLLGGTVGMIPRTVLAVWVGSEARDIQYLLENPNEDLVTKILMLALILLSTFGLGYFLKDKKIA
jgi:uncharacterized membrane protein YdjX (TVP38/TMEM64 family)